MSLSPDPTVTRFRPDDRVGTPNLNTELRTGTWTRLGGQSVLGDVITEAAMEALAQKTRASASAQGYAAGWSQGRRSAEDKARQAAELVARQSTEIDSRREAEHQVAVDALQRAAELLTTTAAQVYASVEGQAVEIAMRLTEALVGRELALATDPGADAVRRALSLLPSVPIVTLRLNPADVPSAAVADLVDAGVRVVADETLQRGDAVAEAEDVVIDASVATALARVSEVLSPCGP